MTPRLFFVFFLITSWQNALAGPSLENMDEYKEKLNQRRISEYATKDKALFNNATDIEYGLQHQSSDDFSNSNRQIGNQLLIRKGLSDKLSLSLSLGKHRARSQDFLLGDTQSFQQKNMHIGVNYLLTKETPDLPQIYVGLSARERLDYNSDRGIGINFSAFRTLESVTLNGFIDYDRRRVNSVDTLFNNFDQHGLTIGSGLTLTLNHRTALSIGLNIRRPHSQNTTTSSQLSVTYRLSPTWVSRIGISRQESNGQSSMVSLSLIKTINP